jgi:hypothetical protein
MVPKPTKVLSVAIALIALIIAVLAVQIPTGPNAEQLRREIDKGLPIGAAPGRVVEFAKKQGMEHSSYLEQERMINALKRGVSKGLFSESSVQVRFYFDEKNKLERYTVEKVSTSL